jgi:hypothetical protein
LEILDADADDDDDVDIKWTKESIRREYESLSHRVWIIMI